MNVKVWFADAGKTVRTWLSGLSFRTGVIVLAMCVPFYVISFAQMALPISHSLKTVLWAIFFGAAKLIQYIGVLILGAEGVRRLKSWWSRRRGKTDGK